MGPGAGSHQPGCDPSLGPQRSKRSTGRLGVRCPTQAGNSGRVKLCLVVLGQRRWNKGEWGHWGVLTSGTHAVDLCRPALAPPQWPPMRGGWGPGGLGAVF